MQCEIQFISKCFHFKNLELGGEEDLQYFRLYNSYDKRKKVKKYKIQNILKSFHSKIICFAWKIIQYVQLTNGSYDKRNKLIKCFKHLNLKYFHNKIWALPDIFCDFLDLKYIVDKSCRTDRKSQHFLTNVSKNIKNKQINK